VIWRAIEDGKTAAELEYLIQCGGDVNQRKPITGETPIELAIKKHSKLSVMHALLQAGCELPTPRETPQGSTLLHLAASEATEPGVISLLVKAGLTPWHRNSNLETPIHVAARSNAVPEVLARLLNEDPHGPATLQLLNDNGECPLCVSAVSNKNTQVRELLVKNGGDLNMASYDWSPLVPEMRLSWGFKLF
jgi:ankyrin repeat protein